MCVQSSILHLQYDYMRPMHAVGEYTMTSLGIVWAWINVVLSFRTHPQLSSLFLCWLRVFLVIVTSIVMIVYTVIPVLLVIFF